MNNTRVCTCCFIAKPLDAYEWALDAYTGEKRWRRKCCRSCAHLTPWERKQRRNNREQAGTVYQQLSLAL
jgi:hypothetical protein